VQDGERTLARDWRSTAEPRRPTTSVATGNGDISVPNEQFLKTIIFAFSKYFPDRSDFNYNLRPRSHNLVLTAKSSSITDKDFIRAYQNDVQKFTDVLASGFPLLSARQHPNCVDCLEVKSEYHQNCSVLDCVTQCSQSAVHLYKQFLQVQQTEFVTLGPLRHA